MPNYITLADHEARRIKEAGSLLVLRPVVPQPPECTVDFIWNEDPDAEYPHLWLSAYETAEYPSVLNFDPWVRSPLGAPGDVLVCKEAWRTEDVPEATYSGAAVRYKADDGLHFVEFAEYEEWDRFPRNGKWRPASIMPAWAVRFRPVVREAGVMRAGDMTEEHLRDTGIAPDMEDSGGTDMAGQWVEVPHYGPAFAAYWNRRFRKYLWESNPWCWTAWVETPEAAARDEWAQREADKRRAMLEDMWWEEQNA